MSTRKCLKREVKQTLLQGKRHHPLQSLSCQMMSQKRSQLKSRNKEVIQMTTQTLRTLIQRMEVLMINQRLRSGWWSSVITTGSMHAFPSKLRRLFQRLQLHVTIDYVGLKRTHPRYPTHWDVSVRILQDNPTGGRIVRGYC
jgi:hypothetical protein